MYEKTYRSLLKSISWRITGTLDTMIISYFVTGSLKISLSIGFVEVFTKMFLYFLHERAWNKINLGRKNVIKEKPFLNEEEYEYEYNQRA
ncbi:DUF2061 domain-containing protein [Melioribacteraceae bacterium 4301-Me]|uniref:DUF2061 domain-containing protein n=1 Tax=Pyranulibacter aquaticus TaxID=3163344 RepID=UPI00359BBAEE